MKATITTMLISMALLAISASATTIETNTGNLINQDSLIRIGTHTVFDYVTGGSNVYIENDGIGSRGALRIKAGFQNSTLRTTDNVQYVWNDETSIVTTTETITVTVNAKLVWETYTKTFEGATKTKTTTTEPLTITYNPHTGTVTLNSPTITSQNGQQTRQQ